MQLSTYHMDMRHAAHVLFMFPCEKFISKAVKRKNPQHEVLGIFRLLGAWK